MTRAISTLSVDLDRTTIDVQIFSLVSSRRRPHFKTLCPDCNKRVFREYKCSSCGQVVEKGIKGYELNDDYVIFEKEEVDVSFPAVVEIVKFTSKERYRKALDELAILPNGKHYLLLPTKDKKKKIRENRIYSALKNYLQDKVAIVEMTIRKKPYLAVLETWKGKIRASGLYYSEQIRRDIDTQYRNVQIEGKEQEVLNDFLSGYYGDPYFKEIKDDYKEQFETMIKARAKGKTILPKRKQEKKAGEDILKIFSTTIAQEVKKKEKVKAR